MHTGNIIQTEQVILRKIYVYIHMCLGVSIAVKKYHNYNKHKGKHIIGVEVYNFRVLVHYHHGGKWRDAGRHSSGEGGESSTSCKQQEMICLTGSGLSIDETP